MVRKGRGRADSSSSSSSSSGSSSSGGSVSSGSGSSYGDDDRDNIKARSSWEEEDENDKEQHSNMGDDPEQDTNHSEPFDEPEDPEQPKSLIDWDNLTPEQQLVYDKYVGDQNRRIRAMAEQKFHLPGQDWKEDWRQYFANNHPLFGICFHDRDHPVGMLMRIGIIISSFTFGLCMTNFFWLAARSSDRNDSLFQVEIGTRPGSNLTSYVVDVDDQNTVQVTPDIVLLWTVGGMLHGAFDNLIWTLSICACCDAGARFEHLQKYKRFGVGMLAFFVMFIMALTTLSVVVRGVIENSEEEFDVSEASSAGVFDDTLDLSSSTKENYEFMMGYTVEMALALLVYFPLLGTIFFWGVLGCFKYPMMGGRPYEMIEERQVLEEMMLNPDEHSQNVWQDEPMFGMKLKDEEGNYKESPILEFFKAKEDPEEPQKKAGFFSRLSRKPPRDESESFVDEPSSSQSRVNEYDTGYPSAATRTRYDPKTGEEVPVKEDSKITSWFKGLRGGNKNGEGKTSREESGRSNDNGYPSINRSSARYDSTTGKEEESKPTKGAEMDYMAYPQANKSSSRYDPTDGSVGKKKKKKKSSKSGGASSDYPSVNKRASRMDVNSSSDKPPKKTKKSKKKKSSK